MACSVGICAVILLLSTVGSGQSILKRQVYESYENHPCIRQCVAGRAMVCEYDFHVEYFITMGKGCVGCPENMTICYNRDCATADGNQRYIMAVNQMLPGPGIYVCENDEVVVRVYNGLRGREGTTIHWHGVHLKNQQFMDGTPMVTQCRIPFGTTFEYRFTADTPGSHLWHAHSGSQRAEGVFGALVIRQPIELDPHRALYNHDLPEHTMMVMDWFTRFTTEIFTYTRQGTGYSKKTTILINGRGVEQDYFNFPENRTTRKYTPTSIFTVEEGQRYRFRVISNGIDNCPIQVSIDNHKIKVIATDGNPFEAVEVESFYIQSGERYDFVLVVDQPVGNYWIRLQGTESGCGRVKAYTGAILRYSEAPEAYPAEEFTSYEQATRSGKSLNKWNVQQPTPEEVQLTDLVGINTELAPEPDVFKPVPDKKFYLRLTVNRVSTYDLGAVRKSVINDISVMNPPSPPLTQYEDLDENIFCNEDTVSVNCSQVYCECVYRIQVAWNDVVELIIIDEGLFAISHPMHIHGHRYFVVGQGKLGDKTTEQEVRRLDQNGQLPRNLVNPVGKDTVASSDGGYVILRWHATNPGFWLFHCHTQFHMLQGQGLIFQVGGKHELPSAPYKFPQCGNWKYTEPIYKDECASGVVKLCAQVGITLSFIFMVLILYF